MHLALVALVGACCCQDVAVGGAVWGQLSNALHVALVGCIVLGGPAVKLLLCSSSSLLISMPSRACHLDQYGGAVQPAHKGQSAVMLHCMASPDVSPALPCITEARQTSCLAHLMASSMSSSKIPWLHAWSSTVSFHCRRHVPCPECGHAGIPGERSCPCATMLLRIEHRQCYVTDMLRSIQARRCADLSEKSCLSGSDHSLFRQRTLTVSKSSRDVARMTCGIAAITSGRKTSAAAP